ncbi:hypothetical protein C8F01DRAFT_1100692 [Mycena amicta]|nr:hypothetical protein C8F01DRAFT_1100692 [Mycena amicta]
MYSGPGYLHYSGSNRVLERPLDVAADSRELKRIKKEIKAQIALIKQAESQQGSNYRLYIQQLEGYFKHIRSTHRLDRALLRTVHAWFGTVVDGTNPEELKTKLKVIWIDFQVASFRETNGPQYPSTQAASYTPTPQHGHPYGPPASPPPSYPYYMHAGPGASALSVSASSAVLGQHGHKPASTETLARLAYANELELQQHLYEGRQNALLQQHSPTEIQRQQQQQQHWQYQAGPSSGNDYSGSIYGYAQSHQEHYESTNSDSGSIYYGYAR